MFCISPSSLCSVLLIAWISSSQTLAQSFKANCAELYVAGQNTSGVYKIDPDGLGAFYVYCNQSAAIGGWTVIQRRLNGFVNFNHIDASKGVRFYKIQNSNWDGIQVRDNNQGDAGNSLDRNNKVPFSTVDKDMSKDNCAHKYGAWWYPTDKCDCGNSMRRSKLDDNWRIPTEAIVSNVEAALSRQRELPESTKDNIRSRIASTIQSASLHDSNLTKDEQHALKRLRNDKDIVILPVDEGRVTTVMDKTDYHDKMDALC
ncbi:techylectin-5A-like [Pocillopora verrucosa]|uniref:techylectin-5A-like n=1 Tax=Pocillopora verrucosa TaxID=203993 RepID=UPI00333F5F25